jgi:uncharacterized membrane protein
MEWMMLLLVFLGVPLALLIWLIVRGNRAADRIEELSRRVGYLEANVAQLRASPQAAAPAAEPEAPTPAPAPEPAASTEPSVTAIPVFRPQESYAAATQLPPPIPPLAPEPIPAPSTPTWRLETAPVLPSFTPPVGEPSFFEKVASGKIDWEQFVGVKLLMWLGGFAAFLTVVFAVKYSFERNWITPELRVAGGFLAGLGMLVVGVLLQRRKQYTVGSQTLCATGVVILYATTFACHSVYHFQFFGLIPTFLMMALITATAFVLSVRLDARVVAILGICGGFLTPILLSTNRDNPLGLFGYIVLLDLGLLAVAQRKRWDFLTLLGAVGTVLMQLGWISGFFVRERYFEGNKILIAVAVFVGFSALFVATWARAQRTGWQNKWLTAAAAGLPIIALCVALYFLGFEPLGHRPGVVFGYVLLVDLCLLAMVWLDDKLAALQMVAGAFAFLLLTVWTVQHLTNDLLSWGLVLYLGFAILHAAVPFVLQQAGRPGTPFWWGHLFPPVALLLMLGPVLKLESASLLLWPFVLLVDLLVLALAVLSASLLWAFAALALTLLIAGCWILQLPAEPMWLSRDLVVIGVVAIFFFAAGIILARLMAARASRSGETGKPVGTPGNLNLALDPESLSRALPAFSVALPFVLLVMVALRLPLTNPSPVFGLAMLLVVLLLGLTRLFPMSWLPLIGLGCVLALEHAWHFRHFSPATATLPLLWYLCFTLLFAAFPFVFWRQLAGRMLPWATAALAGPLHFYLVHRLVKATWPNPYMGLLPVAFALPSIAGLVFLIRSLAADAPKRLTLLAFFGAAALFFVTLVFPIQFERQWITIGWAMEGAALLWLYHRVPHNGLRLAGVGLLITAFTRLALNPAVFLYHARTTTPLWNWYLYAYGLTTACLYLGAWLLAPPRHLVMGSNARALLITLGTVLAFLLLNIEIADYFTEPGTQRLTFDFSGSLARDMTYSIAWGTFALGLVIAGIWKRVRAARFSGIALLGVTLFKLFFHDLANLQALYRVGALLGLAIIAIAASFLYQRFFAANAQPPAEPVQTPTSKTGA